MKKSIRIRNVIGKYNPLARIRRAKMQARLVNKDFSFFTPNCIGGKLCHDLNVEFQSPTVNTMMYQTDFFHFIMNLQSYLIDGEIIFFKHSTFTFPCAKIIVKGLPEVTIHFTHYDSEQEALSAWNRRKSRIRWDNIYVLIQQRDGLTTEQIAQLARNKNFKAIVAFTKENCPDIPYTVYLKKYKNCAEVGAIKKRSWIDDSREYEKYFDFVKWFNEADGKDLSVQKYILAK